MFEYYVHPIGRIFWYDISAFPQVIRPNSWHARSSYSQTWAGRKRGCVKGGCNSLILRLLAFARVCSRLCAFTCVFGPFSERPKSAFVCVCVRLRAFVCVTVYPFYYTPFAAPPQTSGKKRKYRLIVVNGCYLVACRRLIAVNLLLNQNYVTK